MRCPGLAELPSAPLGRSGWPWIEESAPLPDAIADGLPWPRISIVTPSYNQAQFVEETIRSVLLQGYPNLEYIVMDGGSQDGSVEIIQKYARWLSYWTSERDGGQADAINKGFERSTGSVLAWINSDDTLLPGALGAVGVAHVRHPGSVLLGDVLHVSASGAPISMMRQGAVTLRNAVLGEWSDLSWNQPGMFVPRSLYAQVGGLDHTMRYVFDKEWLCRLLCVSSVHYLGLPAATFRFHSQSKTDGERQEWYPEGILMKKRQLRYLREPDRRYGRAVVESLHALACLDARRVRRGAAFWHLTRSFAAYFPICRHGKFQRLCARAGIPLFPIHVIRVLRQAGRSGRRSCDK